MTKEQLFIQLVKQLSDAQLFHGHGVIDAEDEAMMIMMFVLQQDVEQVLTTGRDKIKSHCISSAMQLCLARINTVKPMAYILGVVNYAGLEFIIDARALVPRSPIAELIINNFANCFNIKQVNLVLDLCTGSGCIGIAVAKYYQQIQCDISDISSQALLLAQENIDKHQVKINVIESNLFQAITKSYDLIISNPPYVSADEYHELPTEYKKEPKLGLVSTQDGLHMPVQIMFDAPGYLNDDGFLLLEVGYTDELLADTFPQIKFNWLEFSNGGQGVCVFTKQKLLEYQDYFKHFLD